MNNNLEKVLSILRRLPKDLPIMSIVVEVENSTSAQVFFNGDRTKADIFIGEPPFNHEEHLDVEVK